MRPGTERESGRGGARPKRRVPSPPLPSPPLPTRRLHYAERFLAGAFLGMAGALRIRAVPLGHAGNNFRYANHVRIAAARRLGKSHR